MCVSTIGSAREIAGRFGIHLGEHAGTLAGGIGNARERGINQCRGGHASAGKLFGNSKNRFHRAQV